MEYGTDREGGAVLDGLNPGDRPPYIQERVCTGTQEKLISLLHPWVPWKRHPEETHKVPQGAHTVHPTPPDHTKERGRSIIGPPPSDSKGQGSGGKEEHVDI